jgi:uncharacterized protein YciI
MDELLPAHRDYLHKYREDGVFQLWGRRVPRTGGVIVANGADRERIEAIAAEDPFVRAGAAAYDIIEVAPTGGLPELTDRLQ